MSKSKGFTLVEILVAIAIVAVLASIGFAVYGNLQFVARDTKRKVDLKSISNGLTVFYQFNKRFPAATVNSGGASWATLLNHNYIGAMPLDPINRNSYVYTYTGTDFVFSLCSLLENTNEPLEGNVIPGGGACGGTIGQVYYNITGP